MDNLPLEPEHLAIAVDTLIPLLVVISGVFAAFRSPKRELYSLLGWFGTIALTYWSARFLYDPVLAFAKNPLYTEIIVIGAPLLVGIVLFWLIGVDVTRGATRGDVSIPGRFISFVLGLARGAVLVSVLYVAYAWRVPIDNQPDWFREAKLVPHMQNAGTLMALGMGVEGRTKWANVLSGRDIDQGLTEEPAATTAPAVTTTPTTSGGTGTDGSASSGQTTTEPASTAETAPTTSEQAPTSSAEPALEGPEAEELQQIEEPAPEGPEPEELQQIEE